MLSQNNKSIIFTQYNKMRGLGVERKRLNKALGLAQAKGERPYRTTATSCTCPDHQYRGAVCKHMLSVQLAGQESAPHAIERVGDTYLGIYRNPAGQSERKVITRQEWLRLSAVLETTGPDWGTPEEFDRHSVDIDAINEELFG